MVTFRLAPAELPPGERVYAVGDVHGMAEKLVAIHRAIAADLAARPIARATLIHLGDTIDRGPESALALAEIAAPPAPGITLVNLRGNHEAMALPVLAGANGAARELWMRNGGGATLASFGIDPRTPATTWAATMPAEPLRLLAGLGLMYRAGGYFFVHAGLRPGVPIEEQDPLDLVWIREPFLSYRGEFGAVVVHGHTPMREPVVRANRIGVDTGAVFGGALTAVILEADRMAFLAV